MPARKNRPGKHGALDTVVPERLRLYEIRSDEMELSKKFIIWEGKEPKKDHYVGWPDMDVAERMLKKGFLRKSELTTGCFYLTNLFRRQFKMEEV